MLMIDPKQLDRAIWGKQENKLPTMQSIKFPVKVHSALGWLAAQSDMYKGYWQDREGEKVCYLGALIKITSLSDISSYLAQYPEQRFYGGVTFDQTQPQWPGFPACQFILPQIELRLNDDEQWLYIHNWQSMSAEQRIATLKSLRSETKLRWQSPQFKLVAQHPSQPMWHSLVNSVTQADALKACPKVVLARQSIYQANEHINALALLEQWQQLQPDNYAFYLSNQPDQSFFGVPPERLYQRLGQSLATEALAGTGQSSEQQHTRAKLGQKLLHDTKNNHENQFVADAIYQALTSMSQNIQIAPMQLVEQRHLQHLCQKITAQLHPHTTDTDLLTALHPTPAVAGLPRVKAQHYLAEHEPFDRGWYAGAVGFISQKKSDFTVAIRCAHQNQQQLSVYAGAGIVKGSEAQSEWQELQRKSATIQGLLNV
ncbi:isochorismate synthase [Celerinatantimonas diazotrophica]|uniref:isochorismate synthase n=1 Tax=Celerinatantimonas diazotrophica TaxID=412034 RepID=A0A4R1J975_9GAMM|nr:isochorismate synthase [Celerinatantimonas diazotrophica]TCK46639.1 isochorismate synthase [Celerinatantimonas diazotrophica]CAG9295341.1 Isochorismate synthase MenF [Celerinatantimonas diazotrophica]